MNGFIDIENRIDDAKIKCLREEYHRRKDFNSILRKLANILFKYATAETYDEIKHLAELSKSYVYSGFSYEDGKIIETEDTGYPIYFNLYVSDSSELFGTNIEENKIILSINTITLRKVYTDIEADFIFNENLIKEKFIEYIENKLAHELNSHAIQILNDKNISYFYAKKDKIENFINEFDISKDEKEIISLFFYYFSNKEIEARISEIDYALNNISNDIIRTYCNDDIEKLNNSTITIVIKTTLIKLNIIMIPK